MALSENYVKIGNPTIDNDFILSHSDNENYLDFSDYGTFDTSKSYDIVFRFKSDASYPYCAILSLADGTISISFQMDRLYIVFFGRSFQLSKVYPTEWTYYKFSYLPELPYFHYFTSTDGIEWTKRDQFNIPVYQFENSIHTIGYARGMGIESENTYLDLKNLYITVDGQDWFKAVENKYYPPIVEATEVYSSNKTFRGKKQIVSLDCNNVQFVNNDMSFAFANCSNLTQITNINQNTTNMAYAFAGCPTELYNTGFPAIPNSVNDITGLFAYHTDWTDIPVQAFVNAWSKVPAHLQNNVAGFLDGCTNLTNVPANTLPNFMTNMAYSFRNCRAMTDMPIITENIVDMSEAFYGCYNLVNASYPIPNSVINMYYTFNGCYNLVNAPVIGNSVTNMNHTFYYCQNLVDAPVIPNSVTDMDGTFSACFNLVNAPVITNNVSNMYYTFYNCQNLTGNMYIKSENVSNAYQCFYNTSLTKNVYIPFTYSNGVNTTTYNSFITAGYKTDGSVNGVYLKDLTGSKEIDVSDYEYTLEDKTVTLTKYVGAGGDVVIPNV